MTAYRHGEQRPRSEPSPGLNRPIADLDGSHIVHCGAVVATRTSRLEEPLMGGLKLDIVLIGCALASCESSPTGPAVYQSSSSSMSLEVVDNGERLRFRYGDDQSDHDGDGVQVGLVRCGYIARNPICVISNPTEGQREVTGDGGFVVASRSRGDEWRFLYHPARWQGDDCNYAVWSSRRGVVEFGPTACIGKRAPTTIWRLVGERGFF